MPEQKWITIDFYRVTMVGAQKPGNFETLLKKVAATPKAERTQGVNGVPFRLHDHGHHGGLHQGDLMRIRMDAIPVKADLSGDTTDIDLKPTEGIGEATAFLYDSSIRVLAIQRTKLGVSASGFVRYFNRFAEDETVTLQALIEEDAEEKLDKLQEVRSFEIEVAGIPPELEQNASTKEILALMQHADAPKIILSLGMGHQKGSLKTSFIKKLAKTLAQMPWSKEEPKGSTKIFVAGKDALDETLALDLLRFRVVETEQVGSVDRRIPYAARNAALRDAWKRRAAQLKKLSG